MSFRPRGFGLVDVIVGVALMLVLFLALFGVLKASLMVSSLARAKAGATAIAKTQMEYLRGLSYDALGTVGGIPAGTVAQDTSTVANGIDYTMHTFISYVDDAADGAGAQDTNHITTDYKRARVTISYHAVGQEKEVRIVSNFAPAGIEAAGAGGTLEIQVVDATGAPVTVANVAVTNTALAPAVNLATFTNSAGIVSLPGAATSTQYQVAAGKAGYSSAQTYARDATNQNPSPGYLTVVQNQTTVGTFSIDLLSTLSLSTFSPVATSTFADTFATDTKLASMSSTTIETGALTLLPGETNGSAQSIATAPSRLAEWGEATATTSVPAGASVLARVYDGAGVLVPEGALPGNTAGFSTFPISLYALSTTTYPSLALGADLSASADSPSITAWSLSYTAGPTPLPNISFTLTGAKTVGSTGSGSPLYKTVTNGSTGSSASASLTLEWDAYALSVAGYDVVDACPTPPYVLAPGSASTASLYLKPATTNSLRVYASDNASNPVSGASVTLARTGFSRTVASSSCGSAYFGSLTAATDYTLTLTKTGYTTTVLTEISVSGPTALGASFP